MATMPRLRTRFHEDVLEGDFRGAQCREALLQQRRRPAQSRSLLAVGFAFLVLSGSGKTHTMTGSRKDEGIIPRMNRCGLVRARGLLSRLRPAVR